MVLKKSQAISLGVLLLINLKLILGYDVNFDMSQFYQMPTLNRFDNYHECMGTFGEDALYCVSDTFIKPDNDSKLYKFIKEYSKDTKKHFRHDNLVRGLCVNSCRELIADLKRNESQFLVEKFAIESKILYDSVNYYKSEEDRVKYADVINKCVNIELMEKYNLKGYSSIEYCLSEHRKPPLDSLDIFVAILMISIVIIVALSSVYDRILRNLSGLDPDIHYKNPFESKKKQIFTLFSIRRNWHILAAPPTSEHQDLKFLHAVRTISMALVVWGHVCYFSEFLPSYNPEVNEGGYSSFVGMLVFNGLQMVQSFLTISGFLMTYLFLTRAQSEKDSSLSIFLKAFFLRYIRFAPLQGIALLLHATWLYRFGMGPIFNKINYAEQEFCRKHWWKNMLFIDNYTNVDEKCMIQTWYLDCDFWLSAAGVIFLLIIRKKPFLRNWLLSAVLAFSAFITSYTVYINKYEAISIFPPETLKNRLVAVTEDEPSYFRLMYTPTHLNIGNYFIGVAAGFIFYELKKNGKVIKKTFFFRFLWYLCVVLGFMNHLSGYIFYNYDLEPQTILVAVIASFIKHLWGLIFAFVMLGIIYKFGWFIPNVFNHSAWRITGKVSFSSYIFHVFIVQYLVMDIYQPVYMDLVKFTALTFAATFMSILVGLFFALSVELPIATVVKMIMTPKQRERKTGIVLDVITENSPMKTDRE